MIDAIGNWLARCAIFAICQRTTIDAKYGSLVTDYRKSDRRLHSLKLISEFKQIDPGRNTYSPSAATLNFCIAAAMPSGALNTAAPATSTSAPACRIE